MNDEYIKIDNNEKRKKEKKYESCSRVTKKKHTIVFNDDDFS